MYVGPKGPGKNEKISRCSWIFMEKVGRLFLELKPGKTISNKKKVVVLRNSVLVLCY
jgi:hypothetical protein